jgi:hypothetical protein
MSLTCSKCLTRISLSDAGQPPPWCPRCGADHSAYTIQPTSVLGVLREAYTPPPAVAPSPSVGPAPAGAIATGYPVTQEVSRPRPITAASAPLGDIPPEDLEALAPPPRRLPQLGVMIPILAAICLFASVSLTSMAINKLSTYHRTEGRVVDFVRQKTTKTTRVYPVVAYDVGGNRYEFRDAESMGWFAPTYQLGDKVGVLFPPDRPTDGEIYSFGNLWLGPIACAIPGFALLIVCVCAHFAKGTRRRQRQPDYAPLG